MLKRINIASSLRFARNDEGGFSLLEALLATAIMGIGFVGVYSLAVMSEFSLRYAVSKQKMQMQADQILEVIEDDIANIDSYNLSLVTCTAPSQSNTYLVRQYEWCRRLQAENGPGTGNNRSVSVTTLADGRKVVTILLESDAGKAQVIMKRVFTTG